MSKREQILNAAFELILEKGVVNTKIIDIAKKAGIGKGTVYEYFKSKDDILLDIFETRIVREYDKMEDGLKELSGVRKKLSFYLDYKEGMLRRYGPIIGEIPLLLRSEQLGNLSKEIRIAAVRMAARENLVLKNIVEKGIKNGELRDMDPLLAAGYIFTATASHVAAHTFTMSHPDEYPPILSGVDAELFENLSGLFKPCDNDEMIGLVLRGIGA